MGKEKEELLPVSSRQAGDGKRKKASAAQKQRWPQKW